MRPIEACREIPRRYTGRMKTTRLALLAALFALSIGPAFAKAKGKGAKPKAPAPAASASSPAEALEPYINHLDQLLALHRSAPPKGLAFFDQAPGRLATLKQGYAVQRDKAQDADRPKFDAAIATCDRLTAALDERQKVLGDIRAAQAVQGSGKLESGPRKDNLTQGINGGSTAKAVGAIVERDREKAAARAAKKSAAKSDDALTAMSANRWNKRSIELRQQITASYAKIK